MYIWIGAGGRDPCWEWASFLVCEQAREEKEEQGGVEGRRGVRGVEGWRGEQQGRWEWACIGKKGEGVGGGAAEPNGMDGRMDFTGHAAGLCRVKEALHVKAQRGGPQALREREVNRNEAKRVFHKRQPKIERDATETHLAARAP
jgi:hypothetical protein